MINLNIDYKLWISWMISLILLLGIAGMYFDRAAFKSDRDKQVDAFHIYVAGRCLDKMSEKRFEDVCGLGLEECTRIIRNCKSSIITVKDLLGYENN